MMREKRRKKRKKVHQFCPPTAGTQGCVDGCESRCCGTETPLISFSFPEQWRLILNQQPADREADKSRREISAIPCHNRLANIVYISVLHRNWYS